MHAETQLRLGFASEDYGYAEDLCLPIPSATMLGLDPEIKAEAIWVGDRLGMRNSIATRAGPAMTVTGERGQKTALPIRLAAYESMLMQAADPATLPELLDLRERVRDWRFYDHFRTDPEAPARSARVGTRSPVLASDGADLAAAFQTIREIGDGPALDDAVEDAFPGASIEVGEVSGLLELRMYQRGLAEALDDMPNRPFPVDRTSWMTHGRIPQKRLWKSNVEKFRGTGGDHTAPSEKCASL